MERTSDVKKKYDSAKIRLSGLTKIIRFRETFGKIILKSKGILKLIQYCYLSGESIYVPLFACILHIWYKYSFLFSIQYDYLNTKTKYSNCFIEKQQLTKNIAPLGFLVGPAEYPRLVYLIEFL